MVRTRVFTCLLFLYLSFWRNREESWDLGTQSLFYMLILSSLPMVWLPNYGWSIWIWVSRLMTLPLYYTFWVFRLLLRKLCQKNYPSNLIHLAYVTNIHSAEYSVEVNQKLCHLRVPLWKAVHALTSSC